MKYELVKSWVEKSGGFWEFPNIRNRIVKKQVNRKEDAKR